MKPYATYSQYTAPGATKTIRSGAGEIHAILASSTAAAGSAQTITLYDNTSGSGNKLIEIKLNENSPQNIFFPPNMPLKFSTGLTITTPAAACCFVIVVY